MAALRNAVRNGSEGHAYLFSGPRGTGKTSTARILAKALNCENLQGGEPCCECTPCVDMEAGRSFDLFELDAASNNGVDAVRDLIERTAVGSPGRTKVYILDEVHMLSPGASNALLKTLEEPPDHVRFVLATTDPQKVLPTIRSRTQHFEFQLLSAAELESQVRWIIADAELDVDDAAVGWVVQKGRGSSRDTLSALDQVVAAGGVVTRDEPVERLYESLVARDTGMAVVAVAESLAQGHDPRVLGAAFLDSLRDAFLVSLDVEVPHLMEHDREQYARWAGELGTPTLTRAMDAVGTALVDMRQAADPRVPLEVALVRLTSPADESIAGLAERIERLEQALSNGATTSAAAPSADQPAAPVAAPEAAAPSPPPASTPAAAAPADVPPPADVPAAPVEPAAASSAGGGPAQARAELARLRAARDGAASSPGNGDRPAGASSATRTPRPAPPPVPGAPPKVPSVPPAEAADTAAGSSDDAAPAAGTAPAADTPPVDAAPPADTEAPADLPGPPPSDAEGVDVAQAALDAVLPQLRAPAKAACKDGRFVGFDGTAAVFELATGVPLRHAERFRADIESAISQHLGRPVSLQMLPDGGAEAVGAPPRISGGAVDLAEAEELVTIDIAELEDANDVAETGIDRLTRAFPGAVVVTEDEVNR